MTIVGGLPALGFLDLLLLVKASVKFDKPRRRQGMKRVHGQYSVIDPISTEELDSKDTLSRGVLNDRSTVIVRRCSGLVGIDRESCDSDGQSASANQKCSRPSR